MPNCCFKKFAPGRPCPSDWPPSCLDCYSGTRSDSTSDWPPTIFVTLPDYTGPECCQEFYSGQTFAMPVQWGPIGPISCNYIDYWHMSFCKLRYPNCWDYFAFWVIAIEGGCRLSVEHHIGWGMWCGGGNASISWYLNIDQPFDKFDHHLNFSDSYGLPWPLPPLCDAQETTVHIYE